MKIDGILLLSQILSTLKAWKDLLHNYSLRQVTEKTWTPQHFKCRLDLYLASVSQMISFLKPEFWAKWLNLFSIHCSQERWGWRGILMSDLIFRKLIFIWPDPHRTEVFPSDVITGDLWECIQSRTSHRYIWPLHKMEQLWLWQHKECSSRQQVLLPLRLCRCKMAGCHVSGSS